MRGEQLSFGKGFSFCVNLVICWLRSASLDECFGGGGVCGGRAALLC